MHASGPRRPGASPGYPVAPTTLRAFAETWLAARALHSRTKIHYERLLENWILSELADLSIGAISPEIVRSWYATVAEGRHTTKAHAYGLLRAILAAAVAHGLIDSNPCVIEGAASSMRVKQVKPVTGPELTAIAYAMPPRYRLAVLMSAWCDIRFGELTELRREDVDLTNGVIHIRRVVVWVDSKPSVRPPRGRSAARDVTIPADLLPGIEEHLRDHAGPELLFPSQQGAQLTTSTLYRPFSSARAVAGRQDLRWHDLRGFRQALP